MKEIGFLRNWTSGLKGAILCFSAIFLLAFFFQLMRGGILGVDGFYHLRMADFYARGIIQDVGNNFHWTKHSIWNGAFVDKDYLWHLYLLPFTFLTDGGASELEFVGILATSLAAALIALVSYFIFFREKVALPLFWVLLLFSVSEVFLYRSMLCRSHLLSIIFCLLGWYAIANRSYRWLFLVALFYTLSYTAPHVLFVLVFIWAGVEVAYNFLSFQTKPSIKDHSASRFERPSFFFYTISFFRNISKPFLSVVLGISVGMLVHPAGTKLISFWYAQNLLVPSQALEIPGLGLAELVFSEGSGGQDEISTLKVGAELYPMTSREFLVRHFIGLALLLFPWVMMTFLRIRPQRKAIFAYGCAVCFFVLSLISQRFAEYFSPFIILAAGMMFSHCFKSQEWKNWKRNSASFVKFVRVVFIIGFLGNFILKPLLLMNKVEERELRIYQPVGDALQKHVPKGESIFHASWDAFPQLFFFAPEYNYVVGLDPTFLYLYSKEDFESYQAIVQGRIKLAGKDFDPFHEIQTRFGMRYVIVRPKLQPILSLYLQRAELIEETKLLAQGEQDGWRLYKLGS